MLVWFSSSFCKQLTCHYKKWQIIRSILKVVFWVCTWYQFSLQGADGTLREVIFKHLMNVTKGLFAVVRSRWRELEKRCWSTQVQPKQDGITSPLLDVAKEGNEARTWQEPRAGITAKSSPHDLRLQTEGQSHCWGLGGSKGKNIYWPLSLFKSQCPARTSERLKSIRT